jgi:hypothetical protein
MSGMPHRLSFISTDVCDVCGIVQDDVEDVVVPGSSSMTGWAVCTREECHQQVNKWQTIYTISEKVLKTALGGNLCVRRSSGDTQDGWCISGDAFYTHNEWLVTVQLRDQCLKKIVSLEELCLWGGIDCNFIKYVNPKFTDNHNTF